jgi:hypothetical protein
MRIILLGAYNTKTKMESIENPKILVAPSPKFVQDQI